MESINAFLLVRRKNLSQFHKIRLGYVQAGAPNVHLIFLKSVVTKINWSI